MRVIDRIGRDDVALVYIAEKEGGKLIEFAESVQPPFPRDKKWVLTISTLFGCPVRCRFCDAGGYYQGRLSAEEIVFQIDYLINTRFLNGTVPVEKFKIQFARTGEPSFNPCVLDVLERLPELYQAPGMLLSLSTVAPHGTDNFFERLKEIKNRHYQNRFQFQFSIHTTAEKQRDWLIPARKWSFGKMAEYGKSFYNRGERKITLNFALAEGMPIDPDVLLQYFSPDVFLIKITPVNPTCQATKNGIISHIVPAKEDYEIVDALKGAGYQVILSIGETEENYIGSNCGQYITSYRRVRKSLKGGYTYLLPKI
ncbi:MAG: radical SAM protein [Candidatus Zixiibacteriota bacterium]